MAAIWQLEITPKNVDKYEASVRATRTDGEDVRVFNIITAILQTEQQQKDALDNIWGQWLKSKANSDAVALFIGALEADGKVALEAKEVI